MYEVLNLVYTGDRGQSLFTGTYEECQKFINRQDDYKFLYEIVPVIKKSVYEKTGTFDNWLCKHYGK